MLDVGWSELLVLAVVAILVIGPKDLPRMLYALGQIIGKVRRSAEDFQRQFNDAMREAGADDIGRDLHALRDLNPANQIRNSIEDAMREPPRASSGESPNDTLEFSSGEDAAPAETPNLPAENGAEAEAAAETAADIPSAKADQGTADAHTQAQADLPGADTPAPSGASPRAAAE